MEGDEDAYDIKRCIILALSNTYLNIKIKGSNNKSYIMNEVHRCKVIMLKRCWLILVRRLPVLIYYSSEKSIHLSNH